MATIRTWDELPKIEILTNLKKLRKAEKEVLILLKHIFSEDIDALGMMIFDESGNDSIDIHITKENLERFEIKKPISSILKALESLEKMPIELKIDNSKMLVSLFYNKDFTETENNIHLKMKVFLAYALSLLPLKDLQLQD